jgi:hypothetical protein
LPVEKVEFEFEFLVFNATFSNISAISWRPVLVVYLGQNPQPSTFSGGPGGSMS